MTDCGFVSSRWQCKGTMTRLELCLTGDYTLEELSCDNNRGKILYKGEFSIRRDTVTVDIGTIENHSEPTPVITTQASDAKTQYQIIKPSADTDIIDK